VLFGSDYPHPEGLAEPNAFVDLLDGLDQPSVRRIMSTNCLELLGATA
jgi:predicted TIM-barrel fold metal-dependent hydrolase